MLVVAAVAFATPASAQRTDQDSKRLEDTFHQCGQIYVIAKAAGLPVSTLNADFIKYAESQGYNHRQVNKMKWRWIAGELREQDWLKATPAERRDVRPKVATLLTQCEGINGT